MTSTGSSNITYILKDITFLPYFKERVQAYCSCKSCLNDLFMKLKSRCLICQCSLNFQIKFHKKVKPCSWVFIKRAISFKMSLELSSFFVSFFDLTAA